MSLDAAGISNKAEAALNHYDASKKETEKINFNEVFIEWTNNTSTKENQAERAALNDTVHKHLPDCSIIDMGVNNQQKLLVVYDKKTHHVQTRSVDDYSKIVEDYDASPALTKMKMTDDQFVQFMAKNADDRREKGNKDRTADKSAESQPKANASPNANTTTDKKSNDNVAPDSKGDQSTKTGQTSEYQVKAHDTLWKIASRSLMEGRSADQKGSVTHDQIRARIKEIMDLNKSGPTAIHNQDRIYIGHKIIMPGQAAKSDAKPKSETQSQSKPGNQSDANTNADDISQCGDADQFDKCQETTNVTPRTESDNNRQTTSEDQPKMFSNPEQQPKRKLDLFENPTIKELMPKQSGSLRFLQKEQPTEE